MMFSLPSFSEKAEEKSFGIFCLESDSTVWKTVKLNVENGLTSICLVFTQFKQKRKEGVWGLLSLWAVAVQISHESFKPGEVGKSSDFSDAFQTLHRVLLKQVHIPRRALWSEVSRTKENRKTKESPNSKISEEREREGDLRVFKVCRSKKPRRFT